MASIRRAGGGNGARDADAPLLHAPPPPPPPHLPPAALALRQFAALLRKNAIITLRSRRAFGLGGAAGLLLQVLLPALFVALMWVPKYYIRPISHAAFLPAEAYDLDSKWWAGPSPYEGPAFHNRNAARVLLAPDTPAVRAAAQLIAAAVSCPSERYKRICSPDAVTSFGCLFGLDAAPAKCAVRRCCLPFSFHARFCKFAALLSAPRRERAHSRANARRPSSPAPLLLSINKHQTPSGPRSLPRRPRVPRARARRPRRRRRVRGGGAAADRGGGAGRRARGLPRRRACGGGRRRRRGGGRRRRQQRQQRRPRRRAAGGLEGCGRRARAAPAAAAAAARGGGGGGSS